MSRRAGAARPWLLLAAGSGLVALAAAFVPSPALIGEWFDKPAVVTVQKLPRLALREMPAASAYAEIVERPLFNTDRTPDPATSVAVSGTADAERPGELSEYRLVGIITGGGAQLAIMERTGAPSLKVSPGDQLAGWRVDRIDSSGLIATKDARSIRIGIPKARAGTTTP